MGKKFKSAVLYGPNKLRVKEEILSQISGYELRKKRDIAKVAIAYCGICGTDVKIYSNPTFDILNKTWWQKLGHEWVGGILELNNRSTKLKVGDRVVGGTPLGGAFSEVAYVPLPSLYKVDKNIDDLAAIFAEPISVVLRYFQYGEDLISRARKIAIFGGGPIGLLAIQVLRRIKDSLIIWGIESSTLKREKLRELGAKEVFSDFDELPSGEIDLAIDCIGKRDLLIKYFRLLNKSGTLIPIGTAEQVSLTPEEWQLFQKKNINVFVGHTRRHASFDVFKKSLSMLKRREVVTDNLVTGIISLEDLVAKGLKADRDRHIKIVVRCARPSLLRNLDSL